MLIKGKAKSEVRFVFIDALHHHTMAAMTIVFSPQNLNSFSCYPVPASCHHAIMLSLDAALNPSSTPHLLMIKLGLTQLIFYFFFSLRFPFLSFSFLCFVFLFFSFSNLFFAKSKSSTRFRTII